MTEVAILHFRNVLLNWYRHHKRDLPWRDSGDPYLVWISEIMLQQTRVDQAIPYFERFVAAFPTVHMLAEASQQDVLRVWEGLGYYSRARNMHEAAKTIVESYDGHVPDSWENILSLKGIGSYTAAAILSIAFNKPYAVVDGNVIRVLTRYLGIRDDVRSLRVKKLIQTTCNDFLDPANPGDFNQALMELGALICTPAHPLCESCPLSGRCTAEKEAATKDIPYKSPGKKRPHYHIGIGIIRNSRNEVLIALRPDNVMLGGLWEFPGGKQEQGEEIDDTVRRELKEELGVSVSVDSFFMKLKHAYSHFSITLHAYLCHLDDVNPSPRSSQEIRWVKPLELTKYPFPKANRKLVNAYLQENSRE